MLYGSEPSPAPAATAAQNDDAEDAEPPDEPHDINSGAKKAAAILGAALLLAVVLIAVALVRFNGTPAQPTGRSAPVAVSAVAVPVPTTLAPPPDHDQAVPYAASANCPPGSTSAQALADTAGDSAWVCVRGAQGAAVDGQVLRIDLGHSYVLSAVSVVPGWVAKTPGGKDEWLQHRVVARLQYIFNDVDRTIFTQDTGSAHGPVTTPLAKKVLASSVTVVILQTARPPASPMPTGGEEASVPVDAADGDPVDATFAMSSLKFLGHEPN